MTIKYNRLKNVWLGATWLKLGWQLFKQQPVTWVVMALIFGVACVVGASFTIGQFFVALFAPVFAGGIFLAMAKSAGGEKAQIEDLFSVFKHQQTFMQLLLIGLIGMAVAGLNILITHMPGSDYMMSAGSSRTAHKDYSPISLGTMLARVITWPWSLALLFAIPLVAIKQHQALPALKSSIWVTLVHLISMVPFCIMLCVLTVIAILPVGLGLLVLLPVTFCAVYSAFTMIYSDSTQISDVVTLTPSQTLKNEPTTQSISNKRVTQAANEVASVELKAHPMPIVNSDLDNVNSNSISNAQRVQQSVNEIALPKQLNIDYFDEYICISRRWFTLSALMLPVLLLIGLGASYYISGAEMSGFSMTGEQWFIDLLPWLGTILTVVACYLSLARCINRTDIFVSSDTIEIKHQPLPWLGNKRLQANKIKQLYVLDKTRVINERTGQTRRSYDVLAVPHYGLNFTLLYGLESHQQALFIEQEIEKYLNIKDQTVHSDVQLRQT